MNINETVFMLDTIFHSFCSESLDWYYIDILAATMPSQLAFIVWPDKYSLNLICSLHMRMCVIQIQIQSHSLCHIHFVWSNLIELIY